MMALNLTKKYHFVILARLKVATNVVYGLFSLDNLID